MLSPGIHRVDLHTSGGIIPAVYHAAPTPGRAVLWVGGAGGGLDGPAGGLYPRLSARLAPTGIASLRLDYRHANEYQACILDALAGLTYLESLGHRQVVLVGHSFGGAVVISAAAASPAAAGVITLSSQNAGTEAAGRLAPRPLLVLHGTADTVLPDITSRDIYHRADEPKEIRLLPGCGHNLDECRAQVDQEVLGFIQRVL